MKKALDKGKLTPSELPQPEGIKYFIEEFKSNTSSPIYGTRRATTPRRREPLIIPKPKPEKTPKKPVKIEPPKPKVPVPNKGFLSRLSSSPMDLGLPISQREIKVKEAKNLEYIALGTALKPWNNLEEAASP
jgi:hypothetical protein